MLEVEPPLTKEGMGSVADPWLLGVDLEALFEAAIGPGLEWDKGSGRLQVKLSGQAGNATVFGPDGGVYTPGGDTPSPTACMRSIDGLPVAPDVVGADSLAGLHNPYNSPQGLQYCIMHGVDLIGVTVSATADDVAWLAEYDTGMVERTRSSVFVDQDARQMASDAIAATYNYAGTVNDPFPLPNPEPGASRRGGWYGWLAQRYHNWMLPEFLARLNGAGVAVLHCHTSGDTLAREDWNVRAALRGVLQYCAQDWAMLAVRDVVNATTVLNAGCTPVLAPALPQAWGETALPYPVDEVTGAGVEWLLLSSYFADEVFTAYRDAGVNVLMWGASRHADRQRVADLGIRGGYSLDPVYYRGVVPPYDYRAVSDPWDHRRPAIGQLTHRTDLKQVGGASVRGYCVAEEQGLIIPAGWGAGYGRPAILCGWEAPVTNPEQYTIRAQMGVVGALPSGSTAKMAILFGAETDADPYAWPRDNSEVNPLGKPEGLTAMYRAWQRVNGQIGIGLWDTAESGSWRVLATLDTPAVASNVLNSYVLDVSPDGITFTRVLTDGTEYTVTTDDVTYRGRYFFIEKEESLDGAANGFAARYANVFYTPG